MELLELHNITKRYPGVTALDGVSMDFRRGEVHAIVGENGAGKSTFIKVISGAIHPDEGEIYLDGKSYTRLDPLQAIDLGVAVVYQELIQFEAMSVADNLFMSEKGNSSLLVDDKARNREAVELLKRFHCDVHPETTVRELSVAVRQIIEISKAIRQKARILILDEPTAAITVEEQQRLFKVIRELKEQGVTVIYISHRLEELSEICDRVTVLRDGKYVATLDMAATDKQTLISLMVGRKLSENYPRRTTPPSDESVLRAEGLSGNGVRDVSFRLHRGEILGFAGLVGAGRTELMQLVYGAARITGGRLFLGDRELKHGSPADALKSGIGLIPEDRKQQGCFLEKPIFWNISASNIKTLCRGIFVDSRREREQADKYGAMMKIKTPDMGALTLSLSGGNQQKVVIAKTMASLPDILIFDEPTRGIDIGARYEIYQLMSELTGQGKSILMVSSDMEELLGMADRILVLHEGRQMGTLDREQFSQELVLALASGITQEG